MNSFFYALLFLIATTGFCQLKAQVDQSGMAEIWSLPEEFFEGHIGERHLRLNLYQPQGVSNLASFNLSYSAYKNSTYRKYQYSFCGTPFFRTHMFVCGIGRVVSDKLLFSQELGIGLMESWQLHKPSFLVSTSSILSIRSLKESEMLIKVDNLPALIWPNSYRVPNCVMTAIWIQKIEQGIDLRFAARYSSGSDIQLFCSIVYSRRADHSFFAGILISPFDLALGYSIQLKNLRFRILFEHSPFWGIAPYSEFKWAYE